MHTIVSAHQMKDGNDSDGRQNQDDRRRKSNEGAERAHRDNDHRQQRESDFQGWNAQPRYRDATGPSPPAAWPWNQQRGNDQGRKAYYGRGAKTRQRNAKRKREGSGAPKSDDQIDKMVANIVEKTKRIPHRVNLPGCPLIPGGWPTPDPHYLRRIREAEACFLCQWVDSEGLPLCDGRHRNAAYQPIVLLTGIGHAGSDGKAATAKREENQGHRRELKKALSFRASPSDSSQDTVVDPKMKALKATKANLEKQAATQQEEARLQREKTARQILSAEEAIQLQQQEKTKKDAEDAAAKEKAEQAQLAVRNVLEKSNDGNAINSNEAAKPEGIASQPIGQASDRELLLAIHESVIDTQTYLLSVIANAVTKLNRTVETHLENATKQQSTFQGENLKERKEFRRDLKKQIGNQMTNRSKDDTEDREKLSKELCDKIDRANEAAQQEMFQLLRAAGEGANPPGVDPSSPRSPDPEVDEEPADQGMAAPAPSPDEDRVEGQAELLPAQPVVEQWMLNTPSPVTPSSFFI